MAYELTINSKVSNPRTRLADGEYDVIIKSLVQREGVDPYVVLQTSDNQEADYYINSDKSLEIFTSSVNKQLDIKVSEDTGFFEWFENIKGSEVKLYVLTVKGINKQGEQQDYTNYYMYKPQMFDAIMAGLV